MEQVIDKPMPQLTELNVANPLMEDPKALWAAWDRDGYLFFRDVLDSAEVKKVRDVYADYLEEMGIADRSGDGCRYNGEPYAHLPLNVIGDLNRREAHLHIHQSAPINAFFNRIFGEEPCWLPFTVHRTGAPGTDPDQYLEFIHEDGTYNPGLPFIICWIPLDEIDREMGGLALAEGLHNGPRLHTTAEDEKVVPIRYDAIPQDAWRSTLYQAGDVLLMNSFTPHSGITNVSHDKFRLSMDARMLVPGSKRPIIGTLQALSGDTVRIEDDRGAHSLGFDAKSYIRNDRGMKLQPGEFADVYKPGQKVIAVFDGGYLVCLRKQV